MATSSVAAGDRELIQQLLEDVGVLDDQLLVGVPKPSATRTILVPILRRWIAERLFYRAQKLILPVQVGFPIASNKHATTLCKAGVYVHWMGPMRFGTIGVSIGQVAARYLGPDGRATTQPSDSLQAAPQKANIFFDQRILFWKGQFYTRTDVIKMHANTLGGVHFDFRKTEDETHIIEIKNYFGFEMKGNNNQMLVGEEIGVGRADPVRRQHIYDATELIAMDTARIFASGIRASDQAFAALLA